MRIQPFELWTLLFPPISKKRAIAIAASSLQGNGEVTTCYATRPANFHIYNMPDEPCWFVYISRRAEHHFVIGSSQVMLISKLTGKILYDGLAGDEG